MRKILFSAFVAFMAMSVVGCSDSKKTKEKTVSKEMVTRRVANLPYFNKIVLDGVLDVSFKQDDSLCVSVTGRKTVAKNVMVRIDGETLILSLSKKDLLRFDRSEKAQVHISSPDLLSVVMKGAGSFTSHGTVDTDTLNVQLFGAGDIEFENIICDKANLNIRGAGDIDVDKLTAQSAEISLLGVGNADVDFVNSGDVSCVLKGVGNIELEGNVRSLTADRQGTGNIETKDLRVGRQ